MIARAFWCIAALLALPFVVPAALRALFRKPKRNLWVVGEPDCGRPGCVECTSWRNRMGVRR